MATKQSQEEQVCPVCLKRLNSRKGFHELGKPTSCDHVFCFLCIFEWAKNMNTCPVDRLKFNQIEVYTSLTRDPVRTVKVLDTSLSLAATEDATYCEICNDCTREDRLLLCDGCDRGYHLDCLSPPLSEVPEDDWYCMSCERIVHSQYNISVVSTDDSDAASEYLPRNGGGASFQLDLSSDVDITGSGSDSDSQLAMSLDSEPESGSSCCEGDEGEEGESSVSAFPFPEILSPGNEDDFIDVTEDTSDITRRHRTDPSSSTRNPRRRASHLVNGAHTALRPLDSSVDDSSSDESTGVFSKRQKRLSSNRDLASPSSSDTSIVITGQSLATKRLRENLRGMFSDGSETEGVGKGKSPLLEPGAKGSRKKLHFPGETTGSLDSRVCTSRNPTTFSDTIVLSSDDDDDDDEKPTGVSVHCEGHSSALRNGHAHPGAQETVLSLDDEGLRRVMPLEGTCSTMASSLNGYAPLPALSESPSRTGAATLAGRKRANNGSVPIQHSQKRPRTKRRRKRIVQHLRRVRNVRKSRRRKKRARAGSSRSRARTAATHTPRQNAMRAAVRESYRHDNHMEGLEWARAILAKASSATPPHRRSNFLQNFPVPTSGYVDRTAAASMTKKLQDLQKASQDALRDSSPPVNRTYGFTPSRKQHIRPSLVSSITPTSSNPTPLGRNRSLHFPSSIPVASNGTTLKGLTTNSTLRKSKVPCVSSMSLPSTNNCASPSPEANKKCPMAQQRMLKEATRRLTKRPQVLIIPVKCRSRRSSAAAEGGSLSSSSEPVTASSSDPLGDMWRGLETLEAKESIIRRDGTIVPSRGSSLEHKAKTHSAHESLTSGSESSQPQRSLNSATGHRATHRPLPAGKDPIVQDPITRRGSETKSYPTTHARGRHFSDSSVGSGGSGYEKGRRPSHANSMGESSCHEVPPSPNDDLLTPLSSKSLHGYTIPKIAKSQLDKKSVYLGSGSDLCQDSDPTPPAQFKRSRRPMRKKKSCFCRSESDTAAPTATLRRPSSESTKQPPSGHNNGKHGHFIPGHQPKRKPTDNGRVASCRQSLVQAKAGLGYSAEHCPSSSARIEIGPPLSVRTAAHEVDRRPLPAKVVSHESRGCLPLKKGVGYSAADHLQSNQNKEEFTACRVIRRSPPVESEEEFTNYRVIRRSPPVQSEEEFTAYRVHRRSPPVQSEEEFTAYRVHRRSPPVQSEEEFTNYRVIRRSPPVQSEEEFTNYRVIRRSPPVESEEEFTGSVTSHLVPFRPAVQTATDAHSERTSGGKDCCTDSRSASSDNPSQTTIPSDIHTNNLDSERSSPDPLTELTFSYLKKSRPSDTSKSAINPLAQTELSSGTQDSSRVERDQTELAQGSSRNDKDNFEPVIRRALDSYFDQGKITNRQYKRILERASKRVQEGLKVCSLNEKLVTKLVANYVKGYRSCALQVAYAKQN